jgi:hypothetical protein
MTPKFTISRNQKKCKSWSFMCPWCSGLHATWIVDWLTTSRSKGVSNHYPSPPRNKHIHTRNKHIHTISWLAETAEINSAPVVESAMMDCRCDIQEMVPVPIFTTYALVERPQSGLPLWWVSEYVVKSCEELGSGAHISW